MVEQRPRGMWVVFVTFVIALMLAVVPMPDTFQWGRPEWVALVLIFWSLTCPHRVGVFVAWLAGLAVDILEGGLLGQNALALTIISYLTLVLHLRLRMYPAWQQAITVFILVGISQVIVRLIDGQIGKVQSPGVMFLLPSLVSALIWPWVSVSLHAVRRVFHVR